MLSFSLDGFKKIRLFVIGIIVMSIIVELRGIENEQCNEKLWHEANRIQAQILNTL